MPQASPTPAAQYTPREIAQRLGAELVAGPAADTPIGHYLFDTRQLLEGPGTLFVALSSTRRDGHQYLAQAAQLGIPAALVSQADPHGPGTQIVVPDTLRALQALARQHRTQFDYAVWGITGSNGKTIVKEWLATLLAEDPTRAVVTSPRSYNSQLGVALSLLELQPTHTVALIEAGISQMGEMAGLAQMIQPTLGIFTHFGDAHDEGFASRIHKLQEKLRLFDTAQRVVCHSDSPAVPQLGAKAFVVGDSPAAHLRVVEALPAPDGWTFRLAESIGSTAPELFVPVGGPAAAYNALLAIAAARLTGLDWPLIRQGLLRLRPVSMRTEILTDNPEITLINDAYNADLASIGNALALLDSQRSHRRRRLILTDLAHQGSAAPALQRRLLDSLLPRYGSDDVLLVGPVYADLAQRDPRLRAWATTDDLLADLHYDDFRDAVVLLKGARSFALERLMPHLSGQATATYLRVDLTALLANLDAFRHWLPPHLAIIPMVKAAAYGIGAWQVAHELEQAGTQTLAVAFTNEGVALRQRGIMTRILVLNADPITLPQAVRQQLEPAIWSLPQLEALAQAVQQAQTRADADLPLPYPLHLELDTGMRRLGFTPSELPVVLARLATLPQLRVDTVFTHLAAADEPQHDDFTRQQLAEFTEALALIRQQYPAVRAHAANTAGILRWDNTPFDAVRLGIGLYGLNPTPDPLALPLQEVGSLHSVVSQIHEYPAGTSIGYGRSARLDRPSRIATVPVGYADGIPRALSNGHGHALVGGQRCPYVGRVCMDMLMLDVTDVPGVRPGDEVVLFGSQTGPRGTATLSVAELALAAQTIAYEILSGISPRVRRVYEKEK
jgi:alanine racemase